MKNLVARSLGILAINLLLTLVVSAQSLDRKPLTDAEALKMVDSLKLKKGSISSHYAHPLEFKSNMPVLSFKDFNSKMPVVILKEDEHAVIKLKRLK